MSRDHVGFIGLGAMGAPMARHLARSGVPVLVYDINPKAVRSVVECGARAVAHPRAIADRARLVLTCLPSFDALRAVVLGKNGLQGGRAIKTYVDCSTTGAGFAREMAAALKPAGIAMLDAPITGNVITAGNGKLGVMCSGSAAAFRDARPVLQRLAGAMVLYIGPQQGKAQTMKLLNNLLSATGMAASCEAFILGVKAGLDPRVMLDVINAGEASSSATRNKFAASVLARKFDFGARMAITIKDITTAVQEAEELGVPMWIARAIREQWHYAISQGAYDRDGTSLITYLEQWAGVEVRTPAVAPAEAPRGYDKLLIKKNIFVCGENLRELLAGRLKPRAGSACTVVGVTPRLSVAAQIEAQLRARSRRRVINLCPIAANDARALAALAEKHGHGYLDAPLTGTLAEARRGALMVLVSGDPAHYETLLPLFKCLGERVFHVDTRPGMAQFMHQINGVLFATLFAVTCEAFVAGAKARLTPQVMTRVMGIETGRNVASAHIMPTQIVTRRFRHGKCIAEALQELDALSAEAARLGVTNWIFEKTRLLYRLAANLGSANDDITRLVTHYEAWAKAEVRSRGK
jgi:3-hydroxyisobutyrate dehydrogenase-like beta-hydroxyacid dehydrogenase